MSGTYKVQPPDLKDAKSYEIFKRELEVWKQITPVPENKRGAVIAAILPNDSEFKKDLRSLIFEELTSNELCTQDGLDKVIAILDFILAVRKAYLK